MNTKLKERFRYKVKPGKKKYWVALSGKMGTQIEKTKHHIVPDSQKSTRYVKNGKKRLVFFDLFFIIKLGYC